MIKIRIENNLENLSIVTNFLYKDNKINDDFLNEKVIEFKNEMIELLDFTFRPENISKYMPRNIKIFNSYLYRNFFLLFIDDKKIFTYKIMLDFITNIQGLLVLQRDIIIYNNIYSGEVDSKYLDKINNIIQIGKSEKAINYLFKIYKYKITDMSNMIDYDLFNYVAPLTSDYNDLKHIFYIKDKLNISNYRFNIDPVLYTKLFNDFYNTRYYGTNIRTFRNVVNSLKNCILINYIDKETFINNFNKNYYKYLLSLYI